MSSKSIEELHDLIHSMSPHEKRYFKRFAQFSGQSETNNYIKTFDQLNGMGHYDEESLDKWIDQVSFRGHFPATIHFLMRLILKSLKQFKSEKDDFVKARDQVEYARILLAKGKYHLAQKFVRKARKMASELEMTGLLIEVLELEKELLFKTEAKKLSEQLEAAQREQRQQLGRLDLEMELKHIREGYNLLRKKDNVLRGEERRAQLESIRSLPVFARIDVPEGFFAQLHLLTLKSRFALSKKEYRNAHLLAQENILHWERNPDWISRQPGLYIQYLSDYLNTCILGLEKDAASETISKILETKVHTNDEEIELLKQSLSTQLVFCLNAGDRIQGEVVVQNIERLLLIHGERISMDRKLNFYYNITIFYFFQGVYKKALQSLNRILNLPRSDLRQGLQAFARIFQILLHYELGDRDLAEYLLRSSSDLLRRRGQLYTLEKTIFKTLRILIQAPNLDLARNDLQQNYESLIELAQNPTGKEPAGAWEFIFWLQSFLEKRSLTDVYLKRVNDRWNLTLD